MNRLTERTDRGYIIKLDNPQNEAEARQQLMSMFAVSVNKLAAYEDTGFEPEEVETLKAENAELKRLLSLAVEEIKGAANLICDIAKHDDSCPFFDYAKRQCGGTWKHADEAEKVLGGSENAKDDRDKRISP